MPAVPTDRQLATIVRHLTLQHLEVERGLRPPDHLQPHMSSAAYLNLRRRHHDGFPRGGPATPADLGTVRLTRYPDGHVYASVATRQQHDRWGALTMQLQPGPDGRYTIVELQRLRLPGIDRHVQPDPTDTLDRQIVRADAERRDVAAALAAEQHRRETSRRRAVDGRIAAHTARLAELDVELAHLQTRQHHRDAVLPDHDPERRAGHTIRLLGDRPPDRAGSLLWDAARDAIDTYRTRWNINDPHSALGPPANDEHQQAHRDAVLRLLRVATPQLRHDPPTDRDRTRAIDR